MAGENVYTFQKRVTTYVIAKNGSAIVATLGGVVAPPDTFLELTDTPSTFTGQALKTPRVNAGETALEFVAAGAGDVVGPASATDGNLAAFDGTTGKLIKDTGVTPSEVASNTSARHTQGTDQGLDTGGANAVTAAQSKAAYTHSGVTSGNPHSVTASDSGAAPAAKGVTNGDSHDHAGGDGAQIDHGGLAGLSDDDHSAVYHNDTRGDARYRNQAGALGNLGATPSFTGVDGTTYTALVDAEITSWAGITLAGGAGIEIQLSNMAANAIATTGLTAAGSGALDDIATHNAILTIANFTGVLIARASVPV